MRKKVASIVIISVLLMQIILPTIPVIAIEATAVLPSTGKWDISAKRDNSVIATLDAEGTLTISGNGAMKNFGYYEGKWNNSTESKNIKNVIIKQGVTNIGNGAFCQCSSLISINIPDGITSIGETAFYECSSLTSINIPERVTSIGEFAFSGCYNLTHINIPEGINIIESAVFQGCSKLTSINIPERVTSIEGYAFNGCNKLTSINIPEGVTKIENSAFYGCNGLISINVEEKNQTYTDVEGILFKKDKTEIIKYPSKKVADKYQIPEGVTNIVDHAFEYCRNLTSINIPEGITSIEECTFISCSNLTSINIPEGVTSIGDYAFHGCVNLTSINIPERVTNIGYNAFGDCSSLISIDVEENNQTYADVDGILFKKDRTELIKYPSKKVADNYKIPQEVTSIENWAFEDCINLTSINIPEGVTSIENWVFYNCNKLTSINIPEGVTNIGVNAFCGCSSLTSINIPEGVINIGEFAFSRCSSLTSINIPERVTSIGDGTFNKCNSLSSIDIPEGVTSIGNNAFYGCSSLTSINIPEGVTSIGNNAFDGCSSLTSINIPERVTSIEKNAFRNSPVNIYCKSNSTAHQYALANNINYSLDDIAPTVEYRTNGNSTVAKSHSTVVNVSDEETGIGIAKYQWTQSKKQPTQESFVEKFENGQTITKNTGDGSWYLWILAKDKVGNTTITKSNEFVLDNTAPTGTVSYSKKSSTNGNMIVTIEANEQLQEVADWELSADKLKLTKIYDKNTTNEEITIEDLAGNKTTVKFTIAEDLEITAPNYENNNPSSNNNSNNKNSSSKNSTNNKTNQATEKLPYAGKEQWIIPAIIVLAIIGGISYKKSRKEF